MMDHCSVIFGPGRSGTSVTMKLLEQAGLRLSAELEPESEDNPDGHFEDLVISRLLQSFVRSLDLSPYQPRAGSWVDAPAYESTRSGLADAVRAELARSPVAWGFKDPRVSLTWPMWQQIFAELKVEPRLVFSSRDAASVVRSLMRAYGFSQPMAEGLYLFRCLHALEDVHEPWYFVPYAEWTRDGVGLLTGLTEHCRIDTTGVDLAAIVHDNFRESLNRQSSGPDIELSGVVNELDALLSECVGNRYDRAQVADFCASVHSRFADFKFVGEALEHERALRQASVFHAARRSASQLKRTVLGLRSR